MVPLRAHQALDPSLTVTLVRVRVDLVTVVAVEILLIQLQTILAELNLVPARQLYHPNLQTAQILGVAVSIKAAGLVLNFCIALPYCF